MLISHSSTKDQLFVLEGKNINVMLIRFLYFLKK
nr:MAG TPA: hypothetical protein [Caudoviricetes sp.]